VSPATVELVGNAREALFPQHTITTKNITVRQRSRTALSQADTERKSHKLQQYFFFSLPDAIFKPVHSFTALKISL